MNRRLPNVPLCVHRFYRFIGTESPAGVMFMTDSKFISFTSLPWEYNLELIIIFNFLNDSTLTELYDIS